MYKYVKDVVHYLNNNEVNIYEMSESMNLGRTSLRKKLISLGYKKNDQEKWVYEGNAADEALDIDLTQRLSSNLTNEQTNNSSNNSLSREVSLYESVIRLKRIKPIRTTIVIEEDLIHQTKQLSKWTKLKISDLYSLAMHELLEKYSPK